MSKIVKFFKAIYLSSFVASIFALSITGLTIERPQNNTETTGASGSDYGVWVKFENFEGYQTKSDPQKISRGGNPVGQNTFINDGDRISVRDLGYSIFPSTDTRSATSTPITSLHTFRKRDGTNIMLRAYGDELEYYHPSIGSWERLKDGYSTSTFGFADHNTNSDQTSFVYFGNAVNNYSRWTGNVTKLRIAASPTDSSLSVVDTTLFPTSGTIIYCGVTTTYSSKTAVSLDSLSPTVSSNCAIGRGVAQVPEEFPNAPKGNILTVLNTRMFVAGVASSSQAIFYSQIADASVFSLNATTTHAANDAGIINMPEGGGGITGMAIDEQVLYVFKRNLIKSVAFSQDADDLPIVRPIKPFDNKSQTVGAVSSKSIFAGGNGIFFITPNNEIMNISRVSGFDYPQVTPISDIIKPTVDAVDFSSARGVYWKNKAYFGAKSSSDSQYNDVLLVYNYHRQAWESPILGLNVGDFSIAKFENDEELYFGSDVTINTYVLTSDPLDDIYGVTANWRSREETFDEPFRLKTIDNFYVEGYIDDNTELTISLLLDEDGYTQTYSTTIVGNEDNNRYRFVSEAFNVMGLNPFGYERFGSNDDFSGKKKFRVYLVKGLRRVPFYSAQVEFASDGENQQWEILRYGFHVIPETQEMKSNLMRSF